MGEIEARKWDIRYVVNRRLKAAFESSEAPKLTTHNFHVAYLVSLIHNNPEAVRELIGMIKEAIERANRGETGRSILLGE